MWMNYADCLGGGTSMSLLDRLMRRFRTVREQDGEMRRRERRTHQLTSQAHRAAERADRLVNDLERLRQGLR